MSLTNFPAMLVSEATGWADVEKAHHTRRWYMTSVVMPMSLLPPLLYMYAETMHPGAIFPASVATPTVLQLIVTGALFYVAQLWMVSYLAMLVQRMALARDHDPGADDSYALATISMIPLWIASLAMLVPSLGFNLAVFGLAALASVELMRHGVKPLLHIPDEKKAHYVASMVTIVGIVTWIGFLLLTAIVLSSLFVRMGMF